MAPKKRKPEATIDLSGSSSEGDEDVDAPVPADFAVTASTTIRVRFPTPEASVLAQRVLEVDAEMQGARVRRTITTQGCDLVTTFDCADARILRVAQSSHFDMLGVVIRTLRDLGPPA